MEQPEAKGSIQVIERMMSLIDALAEMGEPASLKALSKVTGLHPSTAHRILAAMTHSRLVERCDAGTYGLGIRFLELGNIVKARETIQKVAARRSELPAADQRELDRLMRLLSVQM